MRTKVNETVKVTLNATVKYVALATVVALAWPVMGHAQDMQATSKSVAAGLQDMPTIISGVAYLAGGVMVLGGANKLKMHAENPMQTPLSHGLVRIGVGGVVAALPIMMQWVNNTMSTGNQGLGFKKMQKISAVFDGAFGSLFGVS